MSNKNERDGVMEKFTPCLKLTLLPPKEKREVTDTEIAYTLAKLIFLLTTED